MPIAQLPILEHLFCSRKQLLRCMQAGHGERQGLPACKPIFCFALCFRTRCRILRMKTPARTVCMHVFTVGPCSDAGVGHLEA